MRAQAVVRAKSLPDTRAINKQNISLSTHDLIRYTTENEYDWSWLTPVARNPIQHKN